MYTRARPHAPAQGSDISDRRNLQRELRTLVFFPKDDGNQNPRPGSTNIPTFWYREVEFPDEGHQKGLDLCEAARILNECPGL